MDGIAILVAFALVLTALLVVLNFLVVLPSMLKGFKPFGKHEGRRPRYAFRPGSCATFRGGQQCGLLIAGNPFARLTVDERWASVEGMFADVWIDRANTVLVRRLGLFGNGVFFMTSDHSCDGLIFWGTSAGAWRALVAFGWPCEYAPW